MKIFILISLVYSISFNSLSDDYKLCTAIRGNGEAIFAHWSSLAKIVENYGPIDKLAGGSSAAITLFLYESIASNPYISCDSKKESCLKSRSLEISLLLKSLEGYFDYWITTNEVSAVSTLLKTSKGLLSKLKFWTKKAKESLKNSSMLDDYKSIRRDINELVVSGDLAKLINPELKQYLLFALNDFKKSSWLSFNEKVQKSKVLKFRFKEAIDSVTLLLAGGFDAQKDKRIFFRPGLIDFFDVADKFGRIADFYSSYYYEGHINPMVKIKHLEEHRFKFQNFLSKCAPESKNKTWQEIAFRADGRRSSCGYKFLSLVSHYRSKLMSDNVFSVAKRKHRINEKIGTSVFPTTAVLNKEQSLRFKNSFEDYKKTTDTNFGIDWSIPYESLKFGYWGNLVDLEKSKESFESSSLGDNEKSKKMISLGEASWKDILSVSPAEPGLSRLKLIPGTSSISAGGWSDLHPTIFLKSIGCENVIYITRINGESVFGQGVVKKLFNLETPSWDDIGSEVDSLVKRRINNTGKINDQSSAWSMLYNIANPQSAYSKSIKAADAVWCTEWDSYNVLEQGYKPIINGAYNSRLYINEDAKSFITKNPLGPFEGKVISASDLKINSEGWPNYSGCIPLDSMK